ncbi:hypothetical protein LJC42_04010 [Eubacteriales bacterium OttesenSCG-928-K08]|nr:hypothetical protein [Eubacteriales bacterium OttesenSCG-928-K08]
MAAYLPMLVVRTQNVTAAVEMNGAFVGEASSSAHIALPLSESGEYYIGIYPIRGNAHKYFPVVRKLSFVSGALLPVESEDVEVYAWPDRVFEVVFSAGILPQQARLVFPFTVDQLRLPDGCIATLYYEGGLRLAVEEGTRIRYGTVLGSMHHGWLELIDGGRLAVFAGTAVAEGMDFLQEYARLLLILDVEYNELIRLEGDAVGLSEGNPVCYKQLNTLLRHDKKQIFTYEDNGYVAAPEQIGFFTHSPMALETNAQKITAFCEAVLHGLWDDAFAFLTPALREGLDVEMLRACMGEFIGARSPVTKADRAIGLLGEEQLGITPVRMFRFEFENALIDNLFEE